MLRRAAVWALEPGCVAHAPLAVGFCDFLYGRIALFLYRINAGEAGEGRIWSETTSWGEHRICGCASMCSIAIRLLPERGAS